MMLPHRSLLRFRRHVKPPIRVPPLSRSSSTVPSVSSGRLWLFAFAAAGYYGYQKWTNPFPDPWERIKAEAEGVVPPSRTALKGEVLIYKLLPLRTISRMWGFVNELPLPQPLRRPLLGLYSSVFGCDLNEALSDDLTHYPNLGAFFRRDLKPGLRPLDEAALVVAPADGRVVHFGEVKNGMVEQVKGVTYSLNAFLGLVDEDSTEKSEDDVTYVPSRDQTLLKNPAKNRLYQCTFYLGPGDCHRYHSPVDWTVEKRRHFPGDLFSVSPGVVRWLKGLFNYNERVAYSGTWEHGFFCFVPVGATNVGSINAYFDPELSTNQKRPKRSDSLIRSFDKSVTLKKGDPFGEFNLGSSIVLLFEAPPQFEFHVGTGQKIKRGNYVGRLEETTMALTTSVGDKLASTTDTLVTTALSEDGTVVAKKTVSRDDVSETVDHRREEAEAI